MFSPMMATIAVFKFCRSISIFRGTDAGRVSMSADARIPNFADCNKSTGTPLKNYRPGHPSRLIIPALFSSRRPKVLEFVALELIPDAIQKGTSIFEGETAGGK